MENFYVTDSPTFFAQSGEEMLVGPTIDAFKNGSHERPHGGARFAHESMGEIHHACTCLHGGAHLVVLYTSSWLGPSDMFPWVDLFRIHGASPNY